MSGAVSQDVPAFRRLASPYLQIVVSALLVTTAEIFLRKGASSSGSDSGALSVIGIAPLASLWTWLGVFTYVLSMLSWLYVLRHVPISIAFPLVNVVQVLVPLGAAIFLHEAVSLRRWIGISLILCGLATIIRPLVKAEQKL